MTLNFILLYATTVFVASIIPGPSMLLALTHGMQFGAKKTLSSALGNVTVTLIQALISIAGLGTILITSQTAFHIIKLAGAAYLIYLGIGLLFSEKISVKYIKKTNKNDKASLRKMYFQAAYVTAGNPKAIVFFTAIFPQFINSKAAYAPQFCLLMGIGCLIAFSCFMLYAISGQKLVSMFSNANIGKYINRIIGSTFIGTGLSLATSNK